MTIYKTYIKERDKEYTSRGERLQFVAMEIANYISNIDKIKSLYLEIFDSLIEDGFYVYKSNNCEVKIIRKD